MSRTVDWSGPRPKGFGSRFVPTHDPDLVETRSGGGCLSIFGLPFLLAGLFVLQTPLRIIPVENFEAIPWFVYIVLGGTFTAVGAVLVFGRTGMILDRRNGLIIRWHGLLVPMKRTEHSLGDVRRVTLTKDSGDSDSPDTYPVRLEGDLVKPVAVCSPTDYHEARRAAKETAAFLSLPLEDSSSGVKVLREPDKLYESFRDRARRLKEDTSRLPDPPFEMKTIIRETGDGLILEIPVRTSWLSRLLHLVGAALFVGFGLYFFLPFTRLPAPPAVRYALMGVFLVVFILGPLWSVVGKVFPASRNRTVVTVTPASLRVRERIGRKVKLTEIPSDELQELEMPTMKNMLDTIKLPGGLPRQELPDTGVPRLSDGRPVPDSVLWLMKRAGSRGITACGDNASVQFGAGLPEEEMTYLYGLIRKTLIGGQW